MNILKNQQLKKIIQLPPDLILKKCVRKFKRISYFSVLKLRDHYYDSRGQIQFNHRKLRTLPFSIPESLNKYIDPEQAQLFWNHYANHEFDLLGSGWIKCGYFDNATGFEGNRYTGLILQTDSEGNFLNQLLPHCCIKKSKTIWKKIKGNYEPIDWQKDFKSGYRWSTKDWYYPLKLSHLPGGDIKVPWEIGRMQHLPRLSLFYNIFPEQKEEILTEFCNQLLDFIAQNPIRWGVQSMCTMDMGIRTANIALAYTLFKLQKVSIPDSITNIIADFLYDTCYHIYHNLEWSDEFTNNHYLANLAGLLYGSSILPETIQTKKWQKFASTEIQKEFLKQFYEEGSNREGSTLYHRLSSDIIAWSFPLMLRLNLVSKIDEKRLYNAMIFMQELIRPDGLMTSIGDNDSGLFFRLSFTGKGVYEQPNNVYPTISAIAAFFPEVPTQEKDRIEYVFIKSALPSDWKSKIYPRFCQKIIIPNEKVKVYLKKLKYKKTRKIPSDNFNLLDGIHTIAFPKFGVYLIKSKNLYLCISLADIGQNGNGGHGHNDKLSIELFIGKKAIFEDPGTYVYTSSLPMRNLYRSVKAHETIYAGCEQNDFTDIFSMKNETKCKLIKLTPTNLLAEVQYKDIIHLREIIVHKHKIEICDYCNKDFLYSTHKATVCYGYGKMTKSERYIEK